MSELTFFLIASAVCVFAFLTVFSRNIFHSAVWLSMALLSIAGVYFYLGAEFLGVIQVLVYIGGIITLFIFAIKLTANIYDTSIRQLNRQAIFSGLAVFFLFIILLKVIAAYPLGGDSAPLASLNQIGVSLLTTYVLPFEFLSLLLLAAMVGAIVIGKVKK